MITPEWLEYELDLLQTHKDLQESILRDIARRIAKTDMTVTDTAAWQAEMAQETGLLYDEIVKDIAKRTKGTEKEIRQAFADAETEVFNYDDELLIESGQNPETVKHISPKMKRSITAALKKTCTEAKNLKKTTAVTSQTAYHLACDLAHQQVVSGAFTYRDAIKSAIKSAARQGVCVVYPSGHVSSLDVAVRRSVLTGVNATAGSLQDMRANELDCDIMEISAHGGARPEHAEWQGKLVSRSGKKGYLSLSDIGYGEVTGFMGANCRHNWYMYFGGRRMYTEQELDELNNATVTYNDQTYTEYEARMLQRKFERNIRRYKSELVMYDEVLKENDLDDIRAEFNLAARKLKAKEAELADFCKQTNMRRDRYREQVFAADTEKGIRNFGKSTSQKAVWANKRLTNGENGGIIREKIKKSKTSISSPKENLNKKPLSSHSSETQGSELFTHEKRKKLLQYEQILNGNKYETAVIYDEIGDVLFKKKGKSDSVSFTKKELSQMKGKIVTHNHPNNSVLSTADINILRKTKASEMRASTAYGTYVINYPSKWSYEISSYEKIDKAYNKYLDEAYSKAIDKATREGKSRFYYFQEAEESGLSEFCKHYGIKFRKETY